MRLVFELFQVDVGGKLLAPERMIVALDSFSIIMQNLDSNGVPAFPVKSRCLLDTVLPNTKLNSTLKNMNIMDTSLLAEMAGYLDSVNSIIGRIMCSLDIQIGRPLALTRLYYNMLKFACMSINIYSLSILFLSFS